MARTKFIVNPIAGSGNSAGRWERLQPVLRQLGLEYDWEHTTGPRDGVRLAASAVGTGYDTVVAVGGDGTVNEVANGIMLAAGGAPVATQLGIIPTGRGTDICRTVGVPLDYEEAARRLLGTRTVALDIGEVEYVASGVVERRFFVNFAGLGFDVEVTRRANTMAPHGGGTVPYLSSVFLCLLSYRNKPVEMVLDDEVVRRRVNTIVVANGQYFGGGMRIAPQASPLDGFFDVVVLGDLNKLELVLNLPKVYEGSHITHPKVQVWRVQRVEVHSVEPIYLQVDGDPIGETPARLHVIKGALRLIT